MDMDNDDNDGLMMGHDNHTSYDMWYGMDG